MKFAPYSLLPALLLALAACSDDVSAPDAPETDGSVYLFVDLPEETALSRLSYEFVYDYKLQEQLAVRWQLGDIIKLYATSMDAPSGEPPYTDVYADYDAYAAAFPYPMAPSEDQYYRFECVGGEGTAHGIFRYLGLTKATVIYDLVNQNHNVNLDIIYNHKIRDWDRYNGLVIYGNPLRNYMMRHQASNGDLTHLHYGQRMYGLLTSENFDKWFSDPTLASQGAGAKGLLLYNAAGCVFRIKVGNFSRDVYGGAELELDIPGITSGQSNVLLNSPMTLRFGHPNEHQEGMAPWCVANPGGANAVVLPGSSDTNIILAYVVGWPGTFPANTNATLTFHDNFYGITYTWTFSRTTPLTFRHGYYYDIDLTADLPTIN